MNKFYLKEFQFFDVSIILLPQNRQCECVLVPRCRIQSTDLKQQENLHKLQTL